MKPNSGPFRGLCGAALAYALTSGGSNAPEISIEPLGMRIVRPLEEGDDLFARREALLKPRVVGEFLRKYDGAPLPRTDIAQNVLIDMGVPLEKVGNVLSLILEEAQVLGLIEETDGKKRVYLEGVISTPIENNEEGDEFGADVSGSENDGEEPAKTPSREGYTENQPTNGSGNATHEASKRRVFITHGNNKTFINPIKKLLGFGELEAVVSTQRQSVSQPVPDKVMNDMRGCGAAIIHVDAEQKLINQDAEEQIVLNPNVLMEIGAAMALYGRRFILLAPIYLTHPKVRVLSVPACKIGSELSSRKVGRSWPTRNRTATSSATSPTQPGNASGCSSARWPQFPRRK